MERHLLEKHVHQRVSNIMHTAARKSSIKDMQLIRVERGCVAIYYKVTAKRGFFQEAFSEALKFISTHDFSYKGEIPTILYARQVIEKNQKYLRINGKGDRLEKYDRICRNRDEHFYVSRIKIELIIVLEHWCTCVLCLWTYGGQEVQVFTTNILS